MKFVNQKSLFKIIGASALATCMLATSLFAFIPNSTQAEVLSTNQSSSSTQTTTPTTESTGLITPRADDPVLFTTESGIEIKYGNATIQGSLESGNLSGFPYFTTNDGTNDYIWVIIGQSSLSKQFYFGRNPFIISNWKNTSGLVHKDYYNSNITDSTVAGAAIEADSKFLAAKIMDAVRYSDEIPENCVLILANDIVGSGYRQPYNLDGGNSNGGYSYFFYNSNYSKVLKSIFNGYYNNGNFGLSSIKTSICQCNFTSTEYVIKNFYNAPEASNTNFSLYIFPLKQTAPFKWSDYLTSAQIKLTSTQWLFENYNSSGYTSYGQESQQTTKKTTYAYYISSNGTQTTGIDMQSGYRPAFVMSLV